MSLSVTIEHRLGNGQVPQLDGLSEVAQSA